jgi:putative membrane protein
MNNRATVSEVMARRTIHAVCRWLVARRLTLTVEGREHVPVTGPVLVAARHFHHLYDGCALIAVLPRPAYLLVALDWTGGGVTRRVMEPACRLAQWPTVLRPDVLRRAGPRAAVRPAEAGRFLRRATRQVTSLLRAGHVVVVFPEGYPTIDPAGSPKANVGAFLPFRPGVARLAQLAERRGVGRIPIVPAGFQYERDGRWKVWLRFGPPVYAADYAGWHALVVALEERVITLSHPPASRPITTAGVRQ